MRTTVTLDPDVEAIVRRRMKERGVGFKQALNDAIRDAQASRARFTQVTSSMGALPRDVNFNHLAAELEDDALAEKLRRGV